MTDIIHMFTLLKEIDRCFAVLNGTPLPFPDNVSDKYQWLHAEAPFSILAHKAETPPRFIYSNNYALSCFNYTEAEIIGLPSYKSAAEQDREERERLLQAVTKNGIAYNYAGSRIDKYGHVFQIYDGIVWQLFDEAQDHWGQAALFWTDTRERPEWYRI
ncbi:MAG: MEKHLA domain-containing protein [Olivibacter sp.]|nr:MEKHLA domain-containing protein [Olivibacter sp. UJ_SKK_5.1]